MSTKRETYSITYFRRHWQAFFPALAQVHRTTFVRQAANLWAIKERLWGAMRDQFLSYDPTVAIVESFPIPVCQFARAYRCRRFRGEARYGKDHTARQTFDGFRLHVRLCWPGVITQMVLAPANVHEGEVVPDLTAGTSGLLLGDRHYWLPQLKAALRRVGIVLVTPFRRAKHAPPHSWSRVLGRVRYWIDTVFEHLVERCGTKRVWARDLWHERNRRYADGADAHAGGHVQSVRPGSAAAPGAAGGFNDTRRGNTHVTYIRRGEPSRAGGHGMGASGGRSRGGGVAARSAPWNDASRQARAGS